MTDWEHPTVPPSIHSQPDRIDMWLRGLLYVVLVGLVGAAVVGWLGVSEATASDTGDTCDLDVRYTAVTRAGLASPLAFTVTCPDGVPTRFALEIDSAYLAAFDENGLRPAPVEMHSDGTTERWIFEAPVDTTVFQVRFDARLEPAVQSTRTSRVALILGDSEAASVDLVTRVLP